jgi:two-component system, LytTR family, sensor histidine kinase AlgZ
MIAPTLMYVDELRKTWKRATAITVGVAVTTTLVTSGLTHWRAIPAQFVYNLIVAFCVGPLFWLSGPAVGAYVRRLRPTPGWAVRIVSAALIMNVGVSIGLAVLTGLGVLPRTFYLTSLRDAVVPSTVFGVLCVVGFTMYESLKYRARYETAQAKLSSLESRLRPHFLFNTLNSITALIPDDPAAAERVTERLAALLRYSLDATNRSTVRLEQELKVAADYLEIEKIRFGDRLRYTIDVPEALMQCEVPPFSLQTLVENSVKFGGNEIRVSARNGNGRLLLRVWDSGAAGFPEKPNLPAGHGLRNLMERLDTLWGSDASVEFPREVSGTTVQISAPVAPR